MFTAYRYMHGEYRYCIVPKQIEKAGRVGPLTPKEVIMSAHDFILLTMHWKFVQIADKLKIKVKQNEVDLFVADEPTYN